MDKKEIITKLQLVFRDILDNDDIILTEQTAANDIEGWDSLTHIVLVTEIQKEFSIKFTSKEIILWENVGDIIDSINKKI